MTFRVWAPRRTAAQAQGVRGFNPVLLYNAGEAGYLIDAATSALYQDVAGETPAVADGNPVGWPKNLANTREVKFVGSTTRPFLRLSGALRWFEFDGVDDCWFDTAAPHYVAGAASFYCAVRASSQIDKRIFGEGSSDSASPIYSVGTSGSLYPTYASMLQRDDASTTLYAQSNDALFANGNDRVLGAEDDGSSVRWYLDGALVSTRAYTRGTLTLNRFAIGALVRAASSSFFQGRIYAASTITRLLTAAERTNLTTWLASKQGRTL